MESSIDLPDDVPNGSSREASTDAATPSWKDAMFDQSIRHTGPIDPAAQNFTRNAFVAFAPSFEYDRVRDLLARASRGIAWPDRGGVSNPLLPALQCGAAHPKRPEGRCGLSLTPMRTEGPEGDAYAYTSARCSNAERGHRTSFRSHVERPVLEMVAAAYDASAMDQVVRAVAKRAVVARSRVDDLDRLIATRTADYARAATLETAAHRAADTLDAAHWKAQRREAQEAMDILARERDALRRSAAEFALESGLARQLAVVREVTKDVRTLLDRSRAYPGVTRALVRALTRSLTIRQAAPWVAVLEAEFPNGDRERRVVLTGLVPCTQPERVLAHHVFASGGDLAEAAQRLTRPTDRFGPRLLLTPERVVGFALVHRFFETVAPRTGPLETVAGLAARTGSAADAVEAAALSGVFGPAGITADGALLVAPTESELEGALDDYASRQVEAREQWDHGDAARMRTLNKEHGIDAGAVQRGLNTSLPGRYAHDLAGRRYVRLSAIPPTLRTRADRAGGAAALRSAVDAAARAAIDAAGYGTSTTPGDWWLAKALLTQLRTSARAGSKPSLKKARDAGRVLSIPYRGPNPRAGSRPPELLVYCPAAVAQSGDAALVRAWLRGETPRPARDDVAAEATKRRPGHARTKRGGGTRD